VLGSFPGADLVDLYLPGTNGRPEAPAQPSGSRFGEGGSRMDVLARIDGIVFVLVSAVSFVVLSGMNNLFCH
jgi:hypothetical protein